MSAPTPSHDPKKTRRILSLWFPRLAAERLLRAEPGLAEAPLAVIRETGNIREVAALSAAAEAQGAARGQPLSEAVTLCPGLITRPADPAGEAAFLSALRRWAGKFSPWVAEDAPEGLMVDLTGCAHLFGGEEALFRTALADCADLGLSVRAGIADTAGAAWALARYAGGTGLPAPPGRWHRRCAARPRRRKSSGERPRASRPPAPRGRPWRACPSRRCGCRKRRSRGWRGWVCGAWAIFGGCRARD